MNKIPKYNIVTFIFSTVVISSTIVIMFLIKFNVFFISVGIIWIILNIYSIIVTLKLTDIQIIDNDIILKRIFNNKQISLVNFKLKDVSIRRHPYFLIETIKGNILVNYTYDNYQNISELLIKLYPTRLEPFKLMVNKYILLPFKS